MKVRKDTSRAFLDSLTAGVQPAKEERTGEATAQRDEPPAAAPRPLTPGDVRKTSSDQGQVRGPSAMVSLRVGATGVHPFVQEIAAHGKANAARLREENLALLKDEPDPAAALAALETEVARDLEVLVRRSAKGFAGMLRDLRMKTVWEEPGKRDPQYLGYREEVERNLGFFEHRPHYGYASTNDLMKGAGTEFGDVILKLRDARDRVTFCLFDSFDQGTRDNFEQNCFTWDDVPQLIINQRLSKLFEEMPFAYDEAQIFGGIQVADLARVDLPAGPEYDALAKKTQELLPWVEVHRYAKADDRAFFGDGAAPA